MNETRSKWARILRTLATTGLAYVVNYGITLFLTPYITETVGAEAYGFVSLAKQFAQYAVIMVQALNTYAARYIGIAYHQDDKKKANIYFSSVFYGDLVFASAIMTVAVWMIFFLERLLSIPDGIVVDVKLLFLLIFINFWVSTVFSVFGCAGYIRNKLDITGLFKTLSYSTNALVLIICYVLFRPYVFYVGAGTLAATIVVATSDLWITHKFTPEFHPKRSEFDFAVVKRLVMDGFWASMNSVGDLLNNGLDLLVCNQMLSSLAMGQLAIAKTMHTIVQSLYMIVDQAFFPMFLKSYAENDKPKLLDELRLSMKVSGLLTNLTFAGFVALGMAYYRLWIPGQDIDLIYVLTVITILTCIPTGGIHPLYYIYTLTVKIKIPCFVTIAGGIANVVGMYVLIQYFDMGVYAVVWTTAVVMAVINFVTNPLYMAYVLDLPLLTFYPDIVRNVLSCGVLVAVFKGLAMLYEPSSWVTLVLCALVYVVVGMVLHLFIVCNDRQRRQLLAILRRKTKA